jgi:hypothetical protein
MYIQFLQVPSPIVKLVESRRDIQVYQGKQPSNNSSAMKVLDALAGRHFEVLDYFIIIIPLIRFSDESKPLYISSSTFRNKYFSIHRSDKRV